MSQHQHEPPQLAVDPESLPVLPVPVELSDNSQPESWIKEIKILDVPVGVRIRSRRQEDQTWYGLPVR